MAAAIPTLMAIFTLAILAGMLAWSELFEPAIAAAIAGAYQGKHREVKQNGNFKGISTIQQFTGARHGKRDRITYRVCQYYRRFNY